MKNKLTKMCFVCRKHKLWFLVKHRSFLFLPASSTHLKSIDEMCSDCFKKTKEAVLGTGTHKLTNNE